MGRGSFAGNEREFGHERPYLGRGLFACGIGLLVGAIVLATSSVVAGTLGVGTTEARELAGAAAGVGLASLLVGTLAVVPTDRRSWHRAVLGAVIALCGVGAFLWAYPSRWYGDALDLALPIVAVYFFGVITTVSYLFVGVRDVAARANRIEALSTVANAASRTDDVETTAAVPAGSDPVESSSRRARNGPTGTTGPTRARNGGGESSTRAPGGIEYGEGLTIDSGSGNDASGSEDGPAPAPTIDRIESDASDGSVDRVSTSNSSSAAEPRFSIEPLGRSDRSDRDDRSRASNGDPARSRTNRSKRLLRSATASNGTGAATSSADGGAVEADETDERADSPSLSGSDRSVEPTRSVGVGASATDRSPDGSQEPATDDEPLDTLRFGPSVDEYCGNCAHFRYVRTEQGLEPYCGYHEEVMNDMESCLEWAPNS